MCQRRSNTHSQVRLSSPLLIIRCHWSKSCQRHVHHESQRKESTQRNCSRKESAIRRLPFLDSVAQRDWDKSHQWHMTHEPQSKESTQHDCFRLTPLFFCPSLQCGLILALCKRDMISVTSLWVHCLPSL